MLVVKAQTQILDDLIQHGIALEDDAVGGDQLGGGVNLVAGDGGGGVLPGVDNHQGGSLILGRHQELGDAEARGGQHQRGQDDGQNVLADGVQNLQEVNGLVCFVFLAVGPPIKCFGGAFCGFRR